MLRPFCVVNKDHERREQRSRRAFLLRISLGLKSRTRQTPGNERAWASPQFITGAVTAAKTPWASSFLLLTRLSNCGINEDRATSFTSARAATRISPCSSPCLAKTPSHEPQTLPAKTQDKGRPRRSLKIKGKGTWHEHSLSTPAGVHRFRVHRDPGTIAYQRQTSIRLLDDSTVGWSTVVRASGL